MEDRHAYLIIAHNNFCILEKLLMLLDDERNDIFIHVDAKVADFDFEYFRSLVYKSGLFFTDRRIDVRWGSVSQIECELVLFRNAIEHNQYAYYHLISGVDLPLLTQEEIHVFCAKNRGVEFLGCWVYNPPGGIDYLDRLKYNRLFVKHFRRIRTDFWSKRKHSIMRKIDKVFTLLQKWVGYDRVGDKLGVLYKGANWVSLTDECVRYIVQEMQDKIKYYKRSLCADEIYKQTIIGNSKFKDRIYAGGDLRQIDWKRGGPYTYTKDDFELLVNSSMFFARKFDEKIDIEIVDMVYNYISKKQNNFTEF